MWFHFVLSHALNCKISINWFLTRLKFFRYCCFLSLKSSERTFKIFFILPYFSQVETLSEDHFIGHQLSSNSFIEKDSSLFFFLLLEKLILKRVAGVEIVILMFSLLLVDKNWQGVIGVSETFLMGHFAWFSTFISFSFLSISRRKFRSLKNFTSDLNFVSKGIQFFGNLCQNIHGRLNILNLNILNLCRNIEFSSIILHDSLIHFILHRLHSFHIILDIAANSFKSFKLVS